MIPTLRRDFRIDTADYPVPRLSRIFLPFFNIDLLWFILDEVKFSYLPLVSTQLPFGPWVHVVVSVWVVPPSDGTFLPTVRKFSSVPVAYRGWKAYTVLGPLLPRTPER